MDRPRVRIVALGDVFLGGNIPQTLSGTGSSQVLDSKSAQLLGGADLVFCNLEAPLTHHSVPYRPNGHKINLRGLPEFGDLLSKMRVNVVSLANNHMMDFGLKGLEDTVRILDSLGINYVGAGKNDSLARKPAIIEVRGLRIGFLAYTLIDIPGRHEVQYATEISLGVAHLRLSDVTHDLVALTGRADTKIVSLHWGNAPLPFPTPQQKEIAHQLLDSGADVVIGHHAHQLQGIERVDGKLVAYDLGNFLFPSFYLDENEVIQ